MSDTSGYVMNQTMLRIRDPEVTVAFYRDVLGIEHPPTDPQAN